VRESILLPFFHLYCFGLMDGYWLAFTLLEETQNEKKFEKRITKTKTITRGVLKRRTNLSDS